MKISNSVCMANVSEKLNIPLSLPTFFLLLGVWLMKPLSFTNVWLLFCPLLSYSRLAPLLSFISQLHSVVACICGARSSSGHFDRAPPPMDLVRVESHFFYCTCVLYAQVKFYILLFLKVIHFVQLGVKKVCRVCV